MDVVVQKAVVEVPKQRSGTVATNASTEELIDELRAIAGNDGERVNTVEGRETATEYSRRVKTAIAEREAREKEILQTALASVSSADLGTAAGCSCAAQQLCSALADGVLTNSLALASVILKHILASTPPPAALTSSASAEDATAHEAQCFAALESAAQDFLALKGGDPSPGGDAETTTRSRIVMWLGAVFLNVFVSANWTGPPLKGLEVSPLPWHSGIKAATSTVVGKASTGAASTVTGKAGAGAGVGKEESATVGEGGEGGDGGVGGPQAAICEKLELASKQALEADSEMFFRGAVAPLYLRAALALLEPSQYAIAPPTLAW